MAFSLLLYDLAILTVNSESMYRKKFAQWRWDKAMNFCNYISQQSSLGRPFDAALHESETYYDFFRSDTSLVRSMFQLQAQLGCQYSGASDSFEPRRRANHYDETLPFRFKAIELLVELQGILSRYSTAHAEKALWCDLKYFLSQLFFQSYNLLVTPRLHGLRYPELRPTYLLQLWNDLTELIDFVNTRMTAIVNQEQVADQRMNRTWPEAYVMNTSTPLQDNGFAQIIVLPGIGLTAMV